MSIDTQVARIEGLMEALIVAMKENTAERKAERTGSAVSAGPNGVANKSAAVAAPPAAGKPARGKAPASKYTLEQVVAKAVELRDAIGVDETRKFVAVHGAKSAKELKPEMWEDFVSGVDERIADEPDADDQGEADDV